MEIIAELEGVGRGAYTGSLGYLNRDGDLDLNILIRTLTIEGDTIRFRAGAGIVADSIARARARRDAREGERPAARARRRVVKSVACVSSRAGVGLRSRIERCVRSATTRA